MTENIYPEKVDLSSCEKEPIHIIGATQSHGVLVACNKSNGTITQIGKIVRKSLEFQLLNF